MNAQRVAERRGERDALPNIADGLSAPKQNRVLVVGDGFLPIGSRRRRAGNECDGNAMVSGKSAEVGKGSRVFQRACEYG